MNTPAQRVFAACACVVLIAQPALASLALHTIPSSSVGTVLADDDAIERIMSMVDSPTTSTSGTSSSSQLASLSSSGSLFLADTLAGAAGIAGIAYYSRTGKDPVYAAFDAVASAADALFVPAYQAFKANFVSPESYPASAAQYVGVEGSVGATLGNMMDYVKDKVASYPKMNSLVAANTTTSIPTLPDGYTIAKNWVINTPTGLKKVTANFALIDFGGLNSYLTDKISASSGGATQTVYAVTSTPARTYVIAGDYLFYYSPFQNNPATGCSDLYRAPLADTTDSPTATPESSSSVDYNGIKDGLKSPSPDLAGEIKDAVKNLPDDKKILSSDPAPSAVPAENASPITNNDISNFFTSNTTNIYNQYLTDIQSEDTTISNEVAKAAAETAKAQEEEAEKEAEETFNPITDSAFEEPYNPGEFNIPARFTQFLNNVKSSGLFSFSNDFFNSLPGGGSPIYEIEAGQYGHHTIDLSDTLSTGLAVLKTILLVCFGFLSIRAVIMKR